MKKLYLLACMATLCFSHLLAQHQPNLPDSWTYDPDMIKGFISYTDFEIPENASREAIVFDCPQHTVFGQPLVIDENFFDGLFCAMMSDGTDTAFLGLAFDNFDCDSQLVSGVTFWGFVVPFGDPNLWEHPSISMDFIVMIWDSSFFSNIDNPGHEFVVAATGTPHIIFDGDDPLVLFSFDLNFPEPMVLDTGLISIAQWISGLDEPDGLFAWMMTPTGDGVSLALGTDLMNNLLEGPIPVDFSFCLNQTASIPISNWPVYLSILLIASFILFRMRKWS